MTERETIMSKIAAAFEASVKPFSAENAILENACSGSVETSDPLPRHQPVPGVFVDFRAESGVETIVGPALGGSGLRLQLLERGSSPWYSVSYSIPLAEVKEARYIGHYINCDSAGPARFRVCIRHLLEDGFRDIFSRELVTLTGGEQEDLVFVKLDSDLLAETRAVEVLFFFEGRSFDVTLKEVEILQV